MNKQPGFSLLELMVAVAVAGVLAALALPSFNDLIKNNCMTTTANSFLSSVQIARSEAIKRRDFVFITPVDNLGKTNEWGSGWRIWQDIDNDSTLDAGEEIRQFLPTCTVTIDETGNVTQFSYDVRGFINRTGRFNMCDNRTAETGRDISLSSTGRPSITNLTGVCT